MLNILRYLKSYRTAVLLTILLLVVQAACDLALPAYTSDLVDVGIQQGGIADAVPEEMRRETKERLALFLEGEDLQAFESAYAADGDNRFVLRDLTGEERAA